ncbi:hypothetical protein ACFE04_020924 [Oxalis oulophora]
MNSVQWLLIVASVVFLASFVKRKLRARKKINLPPGPHKLPFIGNLHQLISSNKPHLSLSTLANKHGPIFYLQLGQIPTVVVSSAKLAKELMKTNDIAVSGRPQIFSAKHLFYNCTDMAFAPYSAYWRGVQKLCILELLSVKRVQSFSFIRKEEVERLVHRITGSSYPGKINLSRMLENALLGGFSIGEFFPSIQLIIHSLSGVKARLQHTFRRFNQFFDEVINEHLNSNGEKEHKDIVDVLLDIHKSGSIDGVSLTLDNIKAIIMDMFVGGIDTTFITLDWAMTELIMNPKCLKKAQVEVRNIVGDRKLVLETDLFDLHYMKDVIKETLRLHPPAPILIPRESIQDIKIDEYDIPARTRIYFNAWAIARDPTSWKNPETFEPERFSGSNVDFKGHDFELIPFGARRRICPGISFGMANIELALAQLLHSFHWELPLGISPQDLDLSQVFGITMDLHQYLSSYEDNRVAAKKGEQEMSLDQIFDDNGSDMAVLEDDDESIRIADQELGLMMLSDFFPSGNFLDTMELVDDENALMKDPQGGDIDVGNVNEKNLKTPVLKRRQQVKCIKEQRPKRMRQEHENTGSELSSKKQTSELRRLSTKLSMRRWGVEASLQMQKSEESYQKNTEAKNSGTRKR